MNPDDTPDNKHDSKEIEKLPEEIKIPEELLKGLPEEKQRQIKHFVQVEMFSGPVPNPRLLAAYEKAIPGSGDRIFKITEREQEHDHRITTKLVDADIASQATALTYAFRLAFLMIICGSGLIALGRDLAGFAVLAAAVVSVIGVVLKREADKKQIRESAEDPED